MSEITFPKSQTGFSLIEEATVTEGDLTLAEEFNNLAENMDWLLEGKMTGWAKTPPNLEDQASVDPNGAGMIWVAQHAQAPDSSNCTIGEIAYYQVTGDLIDADATGLFEPGEGLKKRMLTLTLAARIFDIPTPTNQMPLGDNDHFLASDVSYTTSNHLIFSEPLWAGLGDSMGDRRPFHYYRGHNKDVDVPNPWPGLDLYFWVDEGNGNLKFCWNSNHENYFILLHGMVTYGPKWTDLND